MEYLISDIVFLICHFLTLKDIGHLAITCKNLNNVVSDICRKLFTKALGDPPKNLCEAIIQETIERNLYFAERLFHSEVQVHEIIAYKKESNLCFMCKIIGKEKCSHWVERSKRGTITFNQVPAELLIDLKNKSLIHSNLEYYNYHREETFTENYSDYSYVDLIFDYNLPDPDQYRHTEQESFYILLKTLFEYKHEFKPINVQYLLNLFDCKQYYNKPKPKYMDNPQHFFLCYILNIKSLISQAIKHSFSSSKKKGKGTKQKLRKKLSKVGLDIHSLILTCHFCK